MVTLEQKGMSLLEMMYGLVGMLRLCLGLQLAMEPSLQITVTWFKNVEPYTLVGGNPAQFIKYRFEKEQIEKLMTIKWWDWEDEKINRFAPRLCNSNIDEFIQSALTDNEEHETCDTNTVTTIEDTTPDNPN
jgi:hypothetical protein